MPRPRIVHFCPVDKFIPPFIDFIRENLDIDDHIFFLFGDIKKYPIELNEQVILVNRFSLWGRIFILSCKSDKIIIHSLLRKYIVFFALFPFFLKKAYWIIWGADLYLYLSPVKSVKRRIHEFIRCFVIKRISYIVTDINGDAERCRDWYRCKATYIQSFVYPSNIFSGHQPEAYTNKKHIKILIGNSATSSNNHISVFNKLISSNLKRPFKIYCPLSYGDDDYKNTILRTGAQLFGKNFIAITDFLSYEDYTNLLRSIDIAIFAHERQQAYGNTINLLGMGKKVFLNPNSPVWDTLINRGIIVFDKNNLELTLLPKETQLSNFRYISSLHSKDALVQSLNQWMI